MVLAPLFAAAQMVHAQSASERPLTLYSGYGPGTNTDTALRALADIVSKQTGRRVIVENKPGASGTFAATSLLAAKADGNVLAQAPISVFRMPHINASFDPRKDFTWVIGIAGYRFATMVRADAPWKSWKDMIEHARANPGKFTYGTPGQASSLHITMEDIAEREGIKWTAVPYKTGTWVALLGGEINALATSPQWGFVESGQVRVLSVWTERRNPRIPDVPTLKELGYNLVVSSPWGLAGPRGMSPATVKMLHDTIKRAMDNPEFAKLIDRLDQEPIYMSSEAYVKFALSTFETERDVVKRFGLK
jgi:tripartite-type tricarboxylate transporter receptor subunit TctC